jgi:hypothetical protein
MRLVYARSQNVVIGLALIVLSGCEHVGVFEPFREVECVQRAQVSLKSAVEAAEAEGGSALDADYRLDDELGCIRGEPGTYDITLLRNGKVDVLSVDGRSATVGTHQDANVMNALLSSRTYFQGSYSHADMARMMPSLSVTMAQAIDIAEKPGGKAMSAWVEAKEGKPGFKIKVVERGRVRETWVAGT